MDTEGGPRLPADLLRTSQRGNWLPKLRLHHGPHLLSTSVSCRTVAFKPFAKQDQDLCAQNPVWPRKAGNRVGMKGRTLNKPNIAQAGGGEN